MAWALKSELIRQQHGTCAAHLIRFDGMDSTKSSPDMRFAALGDEDSLTRSISKRDERGGEGGGGQGC